MLTREAKLKSWPQFDPPLQPKSIKKFNNQIRPDPDILQERREQEGFSNTYSEFREKIFNGHNAGHLYLSEPRHYVTPTLPSYHGPDDYKFNPIIPKSNIMLASHGEPGQRETPANIAANTFKREAF